MQIAFTNEKCLHPEAHTPECSVICRWLFEQRSSAPVRRDCAPSLLVKNDSFQHYEYLFTTFCLFMFPFPFHHSLIALIRASYFLFIFPSFSLSLSTTPSRTGSGGSARPCPLLSGLARRTDADGALHRGGDQANIPRLQGRMSDRHRQGGNIQGHLFTVLPARW